MNKRFTSVTLEKSFILDADMNSSKAQAGKNWKMKTDHISRDGRDWIRPQGMNRTGL